MEKDPNPLPHFKIIDPRELLCGAAHFLFDHLRHNGLSEHNRGGGPALDRALYDGLRDTEAATTALINMNQMVFDYGTDEQTV